MMAFAVEGDFDAVRKTLHRLELAHLAASLGAVETLAAPPRTSSHVECTAQERAAMGIPESLIRYSVGIEDPEDLIADLDAALRG
jgi:cystathionine gamma-synthase